MSSNLHPMLNVAIKAARAAGAIINRAALDVEAVRISQKQINDFVTEVDHASEKAIIETLLTAYPGHGILAEESGSEYGAKDSEFVWIIDPLDGTTNFLHGLPHWAISVALEFRGEIVAGVVYDPIKDEMFRAEKGGGAFMRNKRLRVSGRKDLNLSVIASGDPAIQNPNKARYLRQTELLMKSVAGIRRYGAASLDLTYVASGRYEGYWEEGLKPWDVAAGMLIVKEAGGIVGTVSGKGDPVHDGDIIAANPLLMDNLRKILSSASKETAAA